MITEVIFDLETKQLFSDVGSHDPRKLGVSVLSLYQRRVDDNINEIEGSMQSFWEADFPKLWPILEQADRIIGFNSLHFDVPALQPYAPFDLKTLPHFDILDIVKNVYGRRVGLSVLARDTLKHTKSDIGINAVLYWAKGDQKSLDELKSYCEMDVATTRDLYDYGLKHKKLIFRNKWNMMEEIAVDFSYVKKAGKNQQIGLF